MKRLVALLGVTALVVTVNAVNAQNRPQPMPLPSGTATSTAQPDWSKVRFPLSAMQYDKLLAPLLDTVRTSPSKLHASQGDADLLVLTIKDCAMRVEADGWVSKQEAKYCDRIISAKIQEIMSYYTAQAGGN